MCLCKILARHDSHRENYINKAGLRIKQESNIAINIGFLLKTDFSGHFIMEKEGTRDYSKLEKFIQDNNIINASLAECLLYHKKVKEKIEGHPELIKNFATISLNPKEALFPAQTLIYLEFFKYLCLTNQNKFLSDALLEAIWKVYYIDTLGEEHLSIFFEVLNSESSSGNIQTLGMFDSPKSVKGFIENYLGNTEKLDLVHFPLCGFNCFEKYFKFANEPTFKGPFRVGNLIGVEMLWKIIFEIQKIEIKELGIKLLVETYKNCISNEAKNKKEIVIDFIQVCFGKTQKDNNKLMIALDLLRIFIAKYFYCYIVNIRLEEADFCQDLDLSEYDSPPLCTFTILHSNKEMQVSISQKLQSSHLIEKISSILQYPPERIILCNVNDVEIHTGALSSLKSKLTIPIFSDFPNFKAEIKTRIT